MRFRTTVVVVEPQRPGRDAHQRREPVELGGDERCVVVADERERERGGLAARNDGDRALGQAARRSVAGAHGMRPSAVRHSPLKSAEAISELPLPSSTTGRPGTDEARIARTPGSRSANSSPASAKTRLERGLHEPRAQRASCFEPR